MKKLFSLFAAVLVAGSMIAGNYMISFTEAAAAGTLNGVVYGEGLTITLTDTDGKMVVDANNATFGLNEEATANYSMRLKTGAKSGSKNQMALVVPEAGTLVICARTGSNSATDRNIVVTDAEGTEIINHILLESDTVVGASSKIYLPVTAEVLPGTYTITYPVGAVNFYAIGLAVDEDEPEATTVTFAAGEGWEATAAAQTYTDSVSGITIATTQGVAGTDQYRVYKSQTFTVSAANAKITKLEFTCTANGAAKYGPGCFTDATAGTYTYTADSCIGTWVGDAASVTLTASLNQVRFTKLVVTYEAVEPQPEPTINYYLVGSLSENGWDHTKAMPMAGDSIVRHMAAGTYEFKVLPTLGSWDGALGYANVDLECSSENVRQSGENVQLILHEAGDVKVKVVAGWMCVTGVFGEPIAADWYLKTASNGWTWAPMAKDSLEGQYFYTYTGTWGGVGANVNNAADDSGSKWFPEASISFLNAANGDDAVPANGTEGTFVYVPSLDQLGFKYYAEVLPTLDSVNTIANLKACYDKGVVKDNDTVVVAGYIVNMFLKPANFVKYGSVSIWLTDTLGGEVKEFELYNCYGFMGDTLQTWGPDYTAEGTSNIDVQYVQDHNKKYNVGDLIVAKGLIKKFNSTYELNTGCFIVEGGEEVVTSLEQIATEPKAVKVIENGRVVIIKNGIRYSVLGVQF